MLAAGAKLTYLLLDGPSLQVFNFTTTMSLFSCVFKLHRIRYHPTLTQVNVELGHVFCQQLLTDFISFNGRLLLLPSSIWLQVTKIFP